MKSGPVSIRRLAKALKTAIAIKRPRLAVRALASSAPPSALCCSSGTAHPLQLAGTARYAALAECEAGGKAPCRPPLFSATSNERVVARGRDSYGVFVLIRWRKEELIDACELEAVLATDELDGVAVLQVQALDHRGGRVL